MATQGYYDENNNFIVSKEEKEESEISTRTHLILVGNYYNKENDIYCMVLQSEINGHLFTSYFYEKRMYRLSVAQAIDIAKSKYFQSMSQITLPKRYRRTIKKIKERKLFRFI